MSITVNKTKYCLNHNTYCYILDALAASELAEYKSRQSKQSRESQSLLHCPYCGAPKNEREKCDYCGLKS